MTGICSVLGGAAWTAACFVHNSLPQGCIGDTCGGRPLRGSLPAGVALVAVAGIMLVVSCVGLLLLARRSRGLGRVGVRPGSSARPGSHSWLPPGWSPQPSTATGRECPGWWCRECCFSGWDWR